MNTTLQDHKYGSVDCICTAYCIITLTCIGNVDVIVSLLSQKSFSFKNGVIVNNLTDLLINKSKMLGISYSHYSKFLFLHVVC